jgi:hypothetical protein
MITHELRTLLHSLSTYQPVVLCMLPCASNYDTHRWSHGRKEYASHGRPRRDDSKATLATLNLANPVSDLEANLAKQDRHFIGTNGYTCWAPGIDDSDENHRLVNSLAYGLKCLAGTCDALESDEHLALVNIAEGYAKAYNFELTRRIRNHSVN